MKHIWPGGSLLWEIRPEFKDKPAGGATQCLLAAIMVLRQARKDGDGREHARKPAQQH